MSIESMMPSSHLILCRPLLLLPSIFPSIRVFSDESSLRMRWPKYQSFSFNISPSNEHPGLISFRMASVTDPTQKHLFFFKFLDSLRSMGDLSFPTRNQSCTPALGGGVLNSGPLGKSLTSILSLFPMGSSLCLLKSSEHPHHSILLPSCFLPFLMNVLLKHVATAGPVPGFSLTPGEKELILSIPDPKFYHADIQRLSKAFEWSTPKAFSQ